MAYANGQISAPVDASDPYYVMGVGQYNGTFDVGHICGNSHGKIKMWAKFKPVRNNSLDPYDDTNWWKSVNNNCGILPKSMSSYTSIPTYMDGTNNGWEYEAPRNNVDWMRILDFEGYNHNATCPIYGWLVSGEPINSSGYSLSITILYGLNYSDTSILNFSDIGLGDMYFGVYAKHKTLQYARRITSQYPITNNDGCTIELPTDNLNTGEWNLYPFISSAAQSILGDETIGTYYTIPTLSAKTINVVTLQEQIVITITASITAGRVYYKVEVTAKGTVLTLNNNALYFRKAENSITDTLEVGEKNIGLNNITLTKDVTATLVDSYFLLESEMENTPIKFVATLGKGNYQQEFLF